MESEEDKIKISKASFKDWLEKLQQESWQLELLISGFALFAIWEARTLVDNFYSYRELHEGVGELTGIFLVAFTWLINVGWRIFFFNLLVHVLARGLWIGAIGLRYVSSEIDYDYFNYAPIFDKFLRKKIGGFDDYIEQLERFSSVLFAYTFLLFFIFFSLTLYFLEIGLIVNYTEGSETGILLILIFLFLGLLAAIDFITMGGIKKIKEKNISRIYFVLYRLFSFLTLSFLYRPLLYNFWDEKYTRRLFLISIPYVILLTILPKIDSEATPFYPPHYHRGGEEGQMVYNYQYYDDERDLRQNNLKGIFRRKHSIIDISLPSSELTGNYGTFFFRTYPTDEKWLTDQKKIIPFKNGGFGLKGYNDTNKDSLITAFNIKRSDAKLPWLRKRREITTKLRKEEITEIGVGILQEGESFILDSLYWTNKIDSIERYWALEKGQYRVNRLKKLSDGLIELAEIRLDDVLINDSCDCKFYEHPNIGEKGLKCYFPMTSLKEGPHLLHLKRKHFNRGTKKDKDYTLDHFVPFYKIKKDF